MKKRNKTKIEVLWTEMSMLDEVLSKGIKVKTMYC